MAVKSLLRQLGPLTLSRGLQGPTNVLASRLVVETDTTGLTAQGKAVQKSGIAYAALL